MIKKGDKVRSLVNKLDITKGNVYHVNKVLIAHVNIIDDAGDEHFISKDNIELVEEFEYGEEVEVSYDEKQWFPKTYIAPNPKTESHIAVNENGATGSYKYCRPIPSEEEKPKTLYGYLPDDVIEGKCLIEYKGRIFKLTEITESD